ncbi:deaminase domain-containing protein [Planktothricoides raciborskii]|uniref:Deaminase domain-containing protein n=2 Tax=Planktothricoides raciborskii TaxID=132608 RepID=A0AAU8JI84_9CYAN|nr:deaminase domain-containing protein [Planktothricoides raciborskii]MBD2545690.1 hypothetical protein [Planktothricoides raciborskii FACHB-1370]MBD2582738.1 hypothetical protein [Planktothricoides raciborskii FACHB-1261]
MNEHYGNEGIPAEYQTIAEALRAQVQQVRQKHIPPRINKITAVPESDGNVAVARLEIFSNPKQIYWFEATSKKSPLNIPGENGGPPQWFHPRLDKALQGEYYNDAHAEYKLFNAIAAKIQESNLPHDLEGILYLYTERDTCSGCYLTGDEFNQRFPNIRVIIFYDRLYP